MGSRSPGYLPTERDATSQRPTFEGDGLHNVDLFNFSWFNFNIGQLPPKSLGKPVLIFLKIDWRQQHSVGKVALSFEEHVQKLVKATLAIHRMDGHWIIDVHRLILADAVNTISTLIFDCRIPPPGK